jgi:predicted MFS family arabinose efflux permease
MAEARAMEGHMQTAGRGEHIDGSPPLFQSWGGRAALTLIVLLLINVVNFVDRQLPFILIEPIKAELHLSDSQVGLLAGLTFALVFSVATLVLARIADRWRPRSMIILTLAVWSGFTALSGMATGFVSLLLARVTVSASEAGSTPSAHALISRLYPARHRALVLAIHSLGVPLGSMIGLVLGGWINEVADWRTAFFIVGLPGILLAVAAAVVLPRTDRVAATRAVGKRQDAAGVRPLLGLGSFRHMAAACAFYACGSYAINVFAASFLIRVHHLSTGQAGLAFGLAFGLGGLAGTFLGGVISDALGQRNPRWRLLVPAIGQLLSFPTALATWLAPDATTAVACLALSYIFGLLYYAPTFAAAQQLAGEGERATATALLSFCLNLIGSSIGPMVVGWTSDRLAPQYGALSLRYALCLMGITILWSAWHFWRGSRLLEADLALTAMRHENSKRRNDERE